MNFGVQTVHCVPAGQTCECFWRSACQPAKFPTCRTTTTECACSCSGTKAPCPKTLCTAEYSHLACLIVDASLCDCHCVNTADPCHIFRDIQCDGGQMVNCTITGNVCNCMCDTEASK
ncbi:uncharacterized protein LOC119459481 [Dermacentor silvarum]|uniref:uncharacterized protein LOC119459481 n=1 Tax=Dermacentor silvarum TaxID=543639 RepID=UPI0021019061|nr:uncharacterized protein LOC119459481 [Dermacentor silvarum]